MGKYVGGFLVEVLKHNMSRQRVATTLKREVLERAHAERARIAKVTGCKPSLAKVLAAAVDRGLPA